MKKKIKKGIVAGVTASVVGVVCTTAVLISDKEAKAAAREQQKQEQIYVEKEKDNEVQETVNEVNRDFPTNFKQNSTARNKTGASALTSPEARALAKLTKNLKSKSENMVVVDVHGWLNTAYGDQKVSKYFANQYGFSTQGLNKNNGGYYAAYAESLGADVSLVELPKPSSPASIEAMNYSGKMINAVNNLIDNYKF